MELRNVKTFIRVARLDSFSKAGENLGYAQSTVTLQIKQLEEELGVLLFERKGKKVTLSQKGKEFLVYANKLIKCEAEAINAVTCEGKPKGELRIGILESLSVSDYIRAIKEYMKNYKEVILIVKIATTLELMNFLSKGLLDIIILLDRKITKPDFQVFFEKEEKIVFFSYLKHPMANKLVTLEDISREKFILTEKGCNYRQVFEEKLSEKGLTVNYCLDIGSTKTIIEYVKDELGISLLPEFNLNEVIDREVSKISVEACHIILYTQVILNKDRWKSPTIKAFLDIISKYFK